jgi:DNA-binding NtrC family response regulator
MSARIFVVDDEPKMAASIATALSRSGHQVETFGAALAALTAHASNPAQVVITDWRMPEIDGLELMRRLHAISPELPVIVMTAHADVPSAVAAMKQGAFDYLTKPFDNDELRALVARALELERLTKENLELRREVGEKYAESSMVAVSDESKRTLELVRRVAPAKAPVAIHGESGTGKELIARLLHYWSDRVGKPFVAVNLKAFSDGVIESELFGHEAGSFTGANERRLGCFERADGGTLFLDEIGEISQGVQAKLLRVLQESEVLRVGGSTPRRIDVRIVSATHRDLRAEIAAGRFREDLYFRLHVIPIQLAPLRSRRADILPLARHFLARHRSRDGLVLSPEAEAALEAHPFTGNVRELENAIERAVVLARGPTIAPEDLLLIPPDRAIPTQSEGSLQEALDAATRARVEAALAATGGRRAEAADLLGIERTTLYRLMKRLGLT